MGALLAAMSSLLWGTGDFMGGTLSRRVHPVAIIRTSHGLAAVVLVGVVTATGEWGRTGAVGWGMGAGVLGATGLGLFYAALARGTMGVVAPVAATGVVVPVAVGLAQGDSPGGTALVGIVVTIVGVVLVSGPERASTAAPGPAPASPPARSDPGSAPAPASTLVPPTIDAGPTGDDVTVGVRGPVAALPDTTPPDATPPDAAPPDTTERAAMRPVPLALIAAVAFGSAQALIAQGSQASVVLALFSMRATTVVGASLMLATVLARAPRPAPSDRRTIVAVAGTDTTAVATFSLATTMGTLSISAVLASLYPAVTALLAWRLHGERLRRIQVVGGVATLAGVALIATG